MRKSNGLVVTLVVILSIAAVVGLTVFNHRFAQSFPGGGDFLPRWLGTRMFIVEGVSPYSEEVTLKVQEMFYGRPAAEGEDPVTFLYPMYSILLFGFPAFFGDYAVARAVWMTILEISLFAIVLLSLRLADWQVSPIKLAILVLFGLLWYHGFRNVINGQIAALITVLILWAILAVRQGEDITAGIFLALTTIKPQMVFLLIPFVLLWAFSHRRFSIFASFFITWVALVLISMALLPTWPLEMLRQIVAYPSYTNIGSVFSIIANFLPGISRPLNLVLQAFGVIILLIEWALAWKKDERWFLYTALITLVLSNFIALRTATTHYVALIPALFLAFRIWEQRWKTNGKWVIYLTLLGLFVGIWALFLSTVQGNVEQPVMYLPVPIFSLLALWWVRWWALRPPKLMLEEFAEIIR